MSYNNTCETGRKLDSLAREPVYDRKNIGEQARITFGQI